MAVGRRLVPFELLPFPIDVFVPLTLVQDAAPQVLLDADIGLAVFGQVAVQFANLVAGDQFGTFARQVVRFPDLLCHVAQRRAVAHRGHHAPVQRVQVLLGYRLDQADVFGFPGPQDPGQAWLRLENVHAIGAAQQAVELIPVVFFDTLGHQAGQAFGLAIRHGCRPKGFHEGAAQRFKPPLVAFRGVAQVVLA
ncbi:hypothetical protein G6F57_020225 [Rhizopus arrhizus]|nr:hypothetical protein G6F22_014026 [Rhizopus arrhizus]KAG1437494.1 hypothetical protein G6F57_020225 [Rhizopus arrhizus]